MLNELPPVETVTLPEAEADSLRGFNDAPNWLYNLQVLWQRRRLIARIAGYAFVVSVAVVFLIPKIYVSQTRIMPPETSNSGPALLAALAGRDFQSQALGGLAMSLMGGRNTGALFVDLLRSGSVANRLIDRFDLQKVYHKRYRVDAAKMLVRRADIAEDKQ